MEDYMNWTLVLIFVLIFAAMRDVNLFGEERGGELDPRGNNE